MKKLSLLTSIALLASSSLYAAEMTQQINNNSVAHIYIKGKIVKGDYAKFSHMLSLYYYNTDIKLNSVRLNSEGGDVDDSIMIAYAIKSTGAHTAVGKNDICTNLCFTLFAAGKERLIDRSAKISAQHINFTEGKTLFTKSTNMDVIYDKFNIPSEIINKMKQSYPKPYQFTDSDKLKFRLGDMEFPAKFIDDGSTKSIYLKGLEYFINEDYAKAKPLLEKAADRSYSLALYVLGHMYRNGYGVEKNKDKFIDYIKKAAGLGHGKSQIFLAEMVGITDKSKSVNQLSKFYNNSKYMPDKQRALALLLAAPEYIENYKKMVNKTHEDFHNDITDGQLLLQYSLVLSDKDTASYYRMLACAAAINFACIDEREDLWD